MDNTNINLQSIFIDYHQECATSESYFKLKIVCSSLSPKPSFHTWHIYLDSGYISKSNILLIII